MKDLKILVFMIILLSVNFGVFAQEEEEKEEIEEIEEVVEETEAEETVIVQAIFDGFEGDSYSFNYKNEDNEDDSLFFKDFAPEILKVYNLKDKKYIGKKFEITFNLSYENEIDEDGDKQEFIKRTVTGLKLLN